jgi:hypothetical protein
MNAMGSKHGIKMPLPVKMVHKASERLERLGLKLPFNSDSISGILENINEEESAKSRPRGIDFPGSDKFLEWVKSTR